MELISVEAAIEAIQEDADWLAAQGSDWQVERMERDKSILQSLSSAEPDADEWCTDCKEYDHERHCCPRWNRVIRETLKDARPEITRCKDCKYWGERGLCDKWDYYISNGDFYCGCAERRQ